MVANYISIIQGEWKLLYVDWFWFAISFPRFNFVKLINKLKIVRSVEPLYWFISNLWFYYRPARLATRSSPPSTNWKFIHSFIRKHLRLRVAFVQKVWSANCLWAQVTIPIFSPQFYRWNNTPIMVKLKLRSPHQCWCKKYD